MKFNSEHSQQEKKSKYKKCTICDPENNFVGLCHSDT